MSADCTFSATAPPIFLRGGFGVGRRLRQRADVVAADAVGGEQRPRLPFAQHAAGLRQLRAHFVARLGRRRGDFACAQQRSRKAR